MTNSLPETPQPSDAGAGAAAAGEASALVEQPAKVIRIGTMIKQLLEEARETPLDEAARTHLAAVHERSVEELKDGLAPELIEELQRISLPLQDDDDTPPSEGELRIAQAQLVGWLEGVFHGIQAAIFAQQAAAQAQLQQMRSPALPPGASPEKDRQTTGQYL